MADTPNKLYYVARDRTTNDLVWLHAENLEAAQRKAGPREILPDTFETYEAAEKFMGVQARRYQTKAQKAEAKAQRNAAEQQAQAAAKAKREAIARTPVPKPGDIINNRTLNEFFRARDIGATVKDVRSILDEMKLAKGKRDHYVVTDEALSFLYQTLERFGALDDEQRLKADDESAEHDTHDDHTEEQDRLTPGSAATAGEVSDVAEAIRGGADQPRPVTQSGEASASASDVTDVINQSNENAELFADTSRRAGENADSVPHAAFSPASNTNPLLPDNLGMESLLGRPVDRLIDKPLPGQAETMRGTIVDVSGQQVKVDYGPRRVPVWVDRNELLDPSQYDVNAKRSTYQVLAALHPSETAPTRPTAKALVGMGPAGMVGLPVYLPETGFGRITGYDPGANQFSISTEITMGLPGATVTKTPEDLLALIETPRSQGRAAAINWQNYQVLHRMLGLQSTPEMSPWQAAALAEQRRAERAATGRARSGGSGARPTQPGVRDLSAGFHPINEYSVLAMTGHGPQTWFGRGENYHPDLHQVGVAVLKRFLIEQAARGTGIKVVTGLNTGFELMAAVAAVQARQEGHSVSLTAVVPHGRFPDLGLKGIPEAARTFMRAEQRRAMAQADELQVLHEAQVTGEAHNVTLASRTAVIVEQADALVGGFTSGSRSAIGYARTLGKSVGTVGPDLAGVMAESRTTPAGPSGHDQRGDIVSRTALTAREEPRTGTEALPGNRPTIIDRVVNRTFFDTEGGAREYAARVGGEVIQTSSGFKVETTQRRVPVPVRSAPAAPPVALAPGIPRSEPKLLPPGPAVPPPAAPPPPVAPPTAAPAPGPSQTAASRSYRALPPSREEIEATTRANAGSKTGKPLSEKALQKRIEENYQKAMARWEGASATGEYAHLGQQHAAYVQQELDAGTFTGKVIPKGVTIPAGTQLAPGVRVHPDTLADFEQRRATPTATEVTSRTRPTKEDIFVHAHRSEVNPYSKPHEASQRRMFEMGYHGYDRPSDLFPATRKAYEEGKAAREALGETASRTALPTEPPPRTEPAPEATPEESAPNRRVPRPRRISAEPRPSQTTPTATPKPQAQPAEPPMPSEEEIHASRIADYEADQRRREAAQAARMKRLYGDALVPAGEEPPHATEPPEYLEDREETSRTAIAGQLEEREQARKAGLEKAYQDWSSLDRTQTANTGWGAHNDPESDEAHAAEVRARLDAEVKAYEAHEGPRAFEEWSNLDQSRSANTHTHAADWTVEDDIAGAAARVGYGPHKYGEWARLGDADRPVPPGHDHVNLEPTPDRSQNRYEEAVRVHDMRAARGTWRSGIDRVADHLVGAMPFRSLLLSGTGQMILGALAQRAFTPNVRGTPLTSSERLQLSIEGALGAMAASNPLIAGSHIRSRVSSQHLAEAQANMLQFAATAVSAHVAGMVAESLVGRGVGVGRARLGLGLGSSASRLAGAAANLGTWVALGVASSAGLFELFRGAAQRQMGVDYYGEVGAMADRARAIDQASQLGQQASAQFEAVFLDEDGDALDFDDDYEPGDFTEGVYDGEGEELPFDIQTVTSDLITGL